MMIEGRKAVDGLRRVYKPGAPLFAMRPLKFQGKTYAMREALPVESMTKAKHLYLWKSGAASHETHGPFDKARKRARPTGKPETWTMIPGERLHVTTPEQRKQKRKQRSE